MIRFIAVTDGGMAGLPQIGSSGTGPADSVRKTTMISRQGACEEIRVDDLKQAVAKVRVNEGKIAFPTSYFQFVGYIIPTPEFEGKELIAC